MLKRVQQQAGDTIIEVLLAVTIFSMIIIAAFSLMNHGMAVAQRSLEVTLVTQQIDAQAEALRFLHDSYIFAYDASLTPSAYTDQAAQWVLLSSLRVTNATTFGSLSATGQCELPSGEYFVVNPKTATIYTLGSFTASPVTYSKIRYGDTNPLDITQVEGIWVQAVYAAPANAPAYYDFHIRACWQSVGSAAPVTLGTIVRLYEP